MKKVIYPLAVYIIVCMIAVLLPASEGYNTFSWKLFVGQLYAIPALLIVVITQLFIYKKHV